MRWTTALQGQCCHGPTTAPPLSCQPRGTATPPPAMGCYHLAASHGALPPCHQLWEIVTPLPTRPVLFMELLPPTAPTISGDKVVQGDKVTEGAQQGTNSPTKSGWDIPKLHMPRSHQEEPGIVQLCAAPPGEKALGKKSVPLSPVPAWPVLPNTTSLAATTRACAKTPGPNHGELHPCNPPAPGCSRRTVLPHPSPACVPGMIPRVQLGSACAEPAPGTSPGKAPGAAAPSSSTSTAPTCSELGPAGRLRPAEDPCALCHCAASPALAQGPECFGGAQAPREECGDSGVGRVGRAVGTGCDSGAGAGVRGERWHPLSPLHTCMLHAHSACTHTRPAAPQVRGERPSREKRLDTRF